MLDFTYAPLPFLLGVRDIKLLSPPLWGRTPKGLEGQETSACTDIMPLEGSRLVLGMTYRLFVKILT